MDGRVRVGGIRGGIYTWVLLRGDGMRAGKGEVVVMSVLGRGAGHGCGKEGGFDQF